MFRRHGCAVGARIWVIPEQQLELLNVVIYFCNLETAFSSPQLAMCLQHRVFLLDHRPTSCHLFFLSRGGCLLFCSTLLLRLLPQGKLFRQFQQANLCRPKCLSLAWVHFYWPTRVPEKGAHMSLGKASPLVESVVREPRNLTSNSCVPRTHSSKEVTNPVIVKHLPTMPQ